MKYILPILLFIFLFVNFPRNAAAQHAYIPIPTDSALWVSEKESWYAYDPTPHSFHYIAGWFEGRDTVINGRTYHCYFEDVPYHMPPQYGHFHATDGIWIRQDTIARKLWMVRDKWNPDDEELIYDFSLQVGDTLRDTSGYYLNPQFGNPSTPVWVNQIDSIYWVDGTWRYRWRMTSNWSFPPTGQAEAIQIEGMGYVTDFWDDPWQIFEPTVSEGRHLSRVICFRVKDQWLYHIPNHWNADCDSLVAHDYLTSGIVSAPVNELASPMLYPNPVWCNGQLKLNSYAGNPKLQYEVKGLNMSGAVVLSVSMRPGTSLNLAPLALAPGMYLFQVCGQTGTILHRQSVLITE